jgi:hypothetical protein
LKWRVLALVTLAACNGDVDKYSNDAGADARPDVAYPQDAGVDAPGVCGPVDVTGFQPTPLVPPNPPHQDKCTSQETSDYAQCQGAKVTSLCKQFADGQPGQTCRQCIETQSTDQRWGVIVFQGTTSGTVNIEGCVDDALGQTTKEKEEDGGTGSCGDLLHASYGCQDQACMACSGDAAETCLDEAVSGGCKSYDQAVESTTGVCGALESDAAPPSVSACFANDTITDPTQRDVDWLTRIVGYMCGP